MRWARFLPRFTVEETEAWRNEAACSNKWESEFECRACVVGVYFRENTTQPLPSKAAHVSCEAYGLDSWLCKAARD